MSKEIGYPYLLLNAPVLNNVFSRQITFIDNGNQVNTMLPAKVCFTKKLNFFLFSQIHVRIISNVSKLTAIHVLWHKGTLARSGVISETTRYGIVHVVIVSIKRTGNVIIPPLSIFRISYLLIVRLCALQCRITDISVEWVVSVGQGEKVIE